MNVVIIGGGASGIAAAIRIKQNNPDAQVMVLEHLEEVLKKIYATGNGKCNITNKEAKGNKITVDFFSSIGLVMREDGQGRMYPYSNQASTVVDILKNACEKLGINIITSCEITKAEYIGNKFFVHSNKGSFEADYLILATGGKSQRALGSDGSGYALAQALGHSITELSPALVQLKSSSKNCRSLKGTRVKCNVKIEINSQIVAEDYGELLFTDYGISGIVVMNLSEHINDRNLQSGKEKAVAIIDLVPEITEEDLRNHMNKFGNLEGILAGKLCNIISKQAENDADKIVKYVKNWRLIITGTKGYDFAQITRGGVRKDELAENNKSKILDKLYITGELTDNQYGCGGFNLDYAFSSGIMAADDICKI